MSIERVRLPPEHERMATQALELAVDQTNERSGLPAFGRVRLLIVFARLPAGGAVPRVTCAHFDLARKLVDGLPLPSRELVASSAELLMRASAGAFVQRGSIVMPSHSAMDELTRAALAVVWEAVPTAVLHARREFFLCVVEAASPVVAHLERPGTFVLH